MIRRWLQRWLRNARGEKDARGDAALAGGFKELYADSALSLIREGGVHPTLGPKLRGEPFGVNGLPTFQKFVRLGVRPDHTVVDYGCGTLRIGVHLIRYLEPGRYWGFDIHEGILDIGRGLVGKDLIDSKKPNLRLIGPDTIAQAAAAAPDFVFSVGVLLHVHPTDLGEYFGNIRKLLEAGGRGLVTARVAEKTVHYWERSWAYAREELDEYLKAFGFAVETLDARPWKSRTGNAVG